MKKLLVFSVLFISCLMISCNYSLPGGFDRMEEGRTKDSIRYLCEYGFTYGTKLHVTDSLLMSLEYENRNIGKVSWRSGNVKVPSGFVGKILFAVTAGLRSGESHWQYAVLQGDSVAGNGKGKVAAWKSVSGKTDSIEQKDKLFFALKGDRILIDDIRKSDNLTWIGVIHQRNGVETHAWTYLDELAKKNARIAPFRWTRYAVPDWKPSTYAIVALAYCIAFFIFVFLIRKRRIAFHIPKVSKNASKIHSILKCWFYGLIGSSAFLGLILMGKERTKVHYYLVPDLFDWSGQPLLINLLNISILGTVALFCMLAVWYFVTQKPVDALKCLIWRIAVVLCALSLFFLVWVLITVVWALITVLIAVIIFYFVFSTASAEMNKAGFHICPRCGYKYSNTDGCPMCRNSPGLTEQYKEESDEYEELKKQGKVF